MVHPAAAAAAHHLPLELLQHCFSFLGEEDRQAVLDVCRSWHATLVAAPELTPTACLRCVYGDEADAAFYEEAAGLTSLPCWQCSHAVCGQLRAGMDDLAQLSPRTLSVCLEGYDWCLTADPNGPTLLPAALQLLSSGTTALELSSYCTDAALAALPLFTRLQRLDLSGNAISIDWAQPASQAALPLLRSLRLQYCSPEPPASLGGAFPVHERVPSSVASALMAASWLECLDIQVPRWSSSIVELCEALPALQDLSLDLQPSSSDDPEAPASAALEADLPMAVAALHCLTRLTALRLAVGTAELDWSDAANGVQLPSLAGLTALTELRLRWLAQPPPDWLQLSNLCSLETADQAGPFLLPRVLQLLPTSLTALELDSYCIKEVPASLARLSRLQRLALTGNAWEVDWAQPAAQALLPLLRTLSLRYTDYIPPACDGGMFESYCSMPDDVSSALLSATCLETLALKVQCWSSNVLELCHALPALRTLSLCLEPDVDSDEAAPCSSLRRDLPLAVSALRQLSHLTAIKLAAGVEWLPQFDDEEFSGPVRLPPLAGLTALTGLELAFLALPPPDLGSLSSLCCLKLQEPVEWEEVSLTGLVSLTMLGGYERSLPAPPLLATLPRLASVHAPDASAEWRAQLDALAPHVAYSAEHW
ncbi:small GTP-binding [Chlorella sorokiniana]|uniref:Small GTP-binding n=1 Tax=Chlorella sorokiniana TaxID=3076 RepID=A0A2P6TN07_CHLSO|nr:small GTP-binding [Chlorella sorokiniana]|eukprot:PRW45711.1 small GTP-binding [Chlorella sorokiniana]